MAGDYLSTVDVFHPPKAWVEGQSPSLQSIFLAMSTSIFRVLALPHPNCMSLLVHSQNFILFPSSHMDTNPLAMPPPLVVLVISVIMLIFIYPVLTFPSMLLPMPQFPSMSEHEVHDVIQLIPAS